MDFPTCSSKTESDGGSERITLPVLPARHVVLIARPLSMQLWLRFIGSVSPGRGQGHFGRGYGQVGRGYARAH